MALTKVTYSMIQGAPINVLDYGADLTGSNDSSTAIQAAIDAAKSAGGGTVYLPAGTYKCDSQLTINSANGVRIIGSGQNIGRTGDSIINYTGTVSPFITATGTSFGIENLNIFYTNVSFTGTLVKMSAYGSYIKDSFLSGESTKNNSQYLLDLDSVVDAEVVNTFFGGSQYAISGVADGATTESNVVSLNKCTFNGQTISCVRNLGQAWSFVNCTFEKLTDLTGSAISMHSSVFAKGTSITGCWFGDATAAGAWAWIEWQGSGLSVTGCYMNGTGYKTADAIRIIGTSTSVSITGNFINAFLNGVNVGSYYLTSANITGNAFNTCVNKITGIASGEMLTYTTGSWTPTFTNLSSSGSYTTTGFYEKVGNTVKFTAYIQPSGGATTTATSAYINNLPYTSASSPYGYDVCSVMDINTPTSIGQGVISANSKNCGVTSWSGKTQTILISGSYTTYEN